MKKLIWLAILLPTFANAQWVNGVIQRNGSNGSVRYFQGVNIDTLAKKSDLIPGLQDSLSAKANKSTTLTINGTSFDLSANRTWNVTAATPFSLSAGYGLTGSAFNGSVARTWTVDTTSIRSVLNSYTKAQIQSFLGLYQPLLSGTGLVKSTAGTISYITDNSGNWNTAFTQTRQWDGGSTGLTAATGRTSLGGTTVGQNLFTLTNPSAITFPRINANNTVSALSASDFRTAIGAGTSSTTGTVTSVAATVPTGLTISGSPITTSGTLAFGLQSGYSIPTTAKQAQWDTAYGWGNPAGVYLPLTGGTLTGALSGTSASFSGTGSFGGSLFLGAGMNMSIYSGSGNVILYADNSGNVGKMSIGSGLSFSGGALSATGGSAGTVTGSGTAGKIPVWNSASDIGDSPLTVTGSNVSASGTVTATSFSGAGTGLTGTAAGLSIGGNAATATLASNSSQWNGTTQTGGAGPVTTYMMAYKGSNNWGPSGQSDVRTFLGLGSNAYTSTAYYPNANPSGFTSNTGTVTSVAATGGTGISISGSPVTTSGTITITNTAPNATHTGDVTGSAALTIANSAVTLAKMANVATSTVFYRKTAGTGAPEVQTLSTLKTDLGLSGTNTGDQTNITGNAGTATKLATARTIAGVSFDGTANISLNNNAITNGAGYITSSAITGKEDASNKSTSTSLGTSDTLYPTQNAVREYVDNKITTGVPQTGETGWNPTSPDLSIAGSSSGWYARTGNLAVMTFTITFPSNSVGTQVRITNSPYYVSATGTGVAFSYNDSGMVIYGRVEYNVGIGTHIVLTDDQGSPVSYGMLSEKTISGSVTVIVND